MWHEQDNVDGTARNSLANERTFLAWFRTAITLITLGAAVLRFRLVKRSQASGFILLGMGVVIMYLGLIFYLRVQRGLHRMHFEPNKIGVGLLVAATFAVGAALLIVNVV